LHFEKAWMEASDLARLAEGSEARAYESLIGIARTAGSGAADFAAVRLGSAVALVAPSVAMPLPFNRVIGLGLWEDATERLVEEASALYSSGFAIEVAPYARPAELVAWLRARRMRRATTTAVHVGRAERLEAPRASVRVERARRDQADAVAELCCSTFGMPKAVSRLIAASVGQPDWRHWLAYLDGEPIAAALSFIDGEAAWLGWAATRPAFRGRGAHAALVAARVSDAAASGCTLVSTETAPSTAERPDPSSRGFERVGFRVAYARSTYIAAGRRSSSAVEGA
jgi:GNAT superfamily N-acetyltransferase